MHILFLAGAGVILLPGLLASAFGFGRLLERAGEMNLELFAWFGMLWTFELLFLGWWPSSLGVKPLDGTRGLRSLIVITGAASVCPGLLNLE